jgi:hypothetical protein
MVDLDWSIDRATGDIRYIGDDHTLEAGDPSYATVIQFHRWVQAFADNEAFDSGGAETDNIEVDIIDSNPTDRSTDNIITLKGIFNVDAEAIEHLYDGTIVQGTGATEERWDGIINFGNPTAHIQVLQDGIVSPDDFWNYGFEAGSETGAGSPTIMTDAGLGATVDALIGYTIINVTDGSRGIITDNDATTVTVAELYGGTLDVWTTADVHHIAIPLNPDSGQGISSRWMVKVRDLGLDIDRRRLIGTSRRYGNTFSEFKINGTAQGNNVFALSDSGDLNNTTSWATIDALADITNQEGLRLIDIDNNLTDEEYYSEWTRGANTINIFYEYMKMSSADATAETLNGQTGEQHRGVTHRMAYDTESGAPAPTTNDKLAYGTFVSHGVVTSGPFVVGEKVAEDTGPNWVGRVIAVDAAAETLIVDIETGSVTTGEDFTSNLGASAQTDATPAGEEIQNASGEFCLFAWDDDTGTGNLYGQVTKGVAPIENTRLFDPTDHTDYFVIDVGSSEEVAVSTPFVGVSTGSALIGAIGLGLEFGDTGDADTYFDLSGNPISPPNTVTFTASGFISGDYVLVTEDDGVDINFDQMAITGGEINGASVTVIPVVAIPPDTPADAFSKGGIRIQRADGLYSLHRYTGLSLAADTFTIPSFNFAGNVVDNGANVFVSYLDLSTVLTAETFAYVYDSDRTHFMRVRDGGASPIKNAEATGVMGITGGVASIGRIDDT